MFKDRDGRTFDCVFTLAKVIALKARFGFSLDDLLVGSEEVQAKLADPETLVNALHFVHESSCEGHGVDAAAFAELLDGPTLIAAHESLQQGCLDFFPPEKRRLMQAALEKGKKVNSLMTDQGLSRLAKTSDETLARQAAPELFREPTPVTETST